MRRLKGWMFANWDRPSLVAFVVALMLLAAMALVAAFGPDDFKQTALFTAGGLLVIAQIIFMWGSRGLVTPLRQAQNAFADGQFETALAILQNLRQRGRADAQALTLLGNTYRQLGMLDESASVLREALAMRPTHYFPLYGFGRTLLASGRYAEAAEAIEAALRAGAPPVVRCDLGEVQYRQGLREEASALLQAAKPFAKEPHRALMTGYLLYRLNVAERPPAELIQAGLAYWQASAERFRHTPYGKALAKDIQCILTLEKEV